MQGLRAQDYRAADTAIPQKLELRKVSIAWVDHPGYTEYSNYFAKKAGDSDAAQSILYLGPPKQDTFDLNLPKPQTGHISFRASARRPQPLFRIQQ
jgi:hypothetical protein